MSDEERLDALHGQWEDATEEGKKVSLEDLCADCPELLEEFRRQIDELRPVDAFLRGALGVDTPPDLSIAAAAMARERFQPTSFYASGAKGDVFIAQDKELLRETALKRIRRGVLGDSNESSEFEREARITGRLEHPGIVPVYGFGQDANGQPFYAMRLIRGQTLQQAIDQFHALARSNLSPGERSQTLKNLLRSFLSVCQTIAYAHSRGIIHRDIKPANVKLGDYGETLVLDWGLAKPTELQDENCTDPINATHLRADVKKTAIGHTKGTPAYMSPEQSLGRWDLVGPLSDIYSLGVMLYTLLTGTIPFPGPNLGEVFAKVQAGHFPAPRQINSAVPAALEAVCLKAMDITREGRYATALQLAADIENWLDDEPVTAWREPFVMRTRRWVKRHWSLVSASTAVLVVLGVSIAIAAVLLGEKNRQLTEAGVVLVNKNSQLAIEIEANVRINNELRDKQFKLQAAFAAARNNFDQADQSILSIMSVMNFNGFNSGSQLIPPAARRAVNQEAREYYRRFIANNSGRAELRLELAFAHLMEAEAEVHLNDNAEALVLLDEARNRFELILMTARDDPQARYGLGSVALDTAILMTRQLKFSDSRKSAMLACEAFAKLCAEKTQPGHRYSGLESPAFKLAGATLALHDAEVETDPRIEGGAARTLPAMDDGPVLPFARLAERALTKELVGKPGVSSAGRGMLGLVLYCLGTELKLRNRNEEGLQAFRRAKTELTIMVNAYPTAYELESMLYSCDYSLAIATFEAGKGADVKPMLQARDRLRELGNRDWGPDHLADRNRTKLFAADCSIMLGMWDIARSERRSALGHFNDALNELDRVALPQKQPDLEIRLDLIASLHRVFDGFSELDADPAVSKSVFERIRAELAELEPVLAKVAWFQRERIFAKAVIGDAKLRMNPPEMNGLRLLEDAIPQFRKFVKDHPGDSNASYQYADALSGYGFYRASLADQVDEGLITLSEARLLIGTFPKNGVRANKAKGLARKVGRCLASVHGSKAVQILNGQESDRKKKALTHIHAALDELADIEKAYPLINSEKQLCNDLQELKCKVEKNQSDNSIF